MSALPEALNSAFGPVVAVSATAFGVAQILQAIAGADQRLGLVTEHRTEVLPLALERLSYTTYATPTSNALHQKGFLTRDQVFRLFGGIDSRLWVLTMTPSRLPLSLTQSLLACEG